MSQQIYLSDGVAGQVKKDPFVHLERVYVP